MCRSRATVAELLTDYCRASIVIRTRAVKNSVQSPSNLLFANKSKVRYFKRANATVMNKLNKFDLPLKACPCMKLNSATILFLSSDGQVIRFISIKRNVRVFKQFRNTIVLRKPRCQHH